MRQPSDKSLRIRKIIEKHPEMSDSEIARKIGMDNEAGKERVRKERPKIGYIREIDIGDIDSQC